MSPSRSARWLACPAYPFVAVDEFHGGRPPDENGGPAFPVMHDLDEGAPDLTARAEIVFVIKQGGHPCHFIGSGRSCFQFPENHRPRFVATPLCRHTVVVGRIHATQTEWKQGGLSRIFSGSGCDKGISPEKKKPWDTIAVDVVMVDRIDAVRKLPDNVSGRVGDVRGDPTGSGGPVTPSSGE